MNVKIVKSEIHGAVCVPQSKSVAHRLMIACALAGYRFAPQSGGADVLATKSCIDILLPSIKIALGTGSDLNGAECANATDTLGSRLKLNAGESGSTLRFLLPVVCALGIGCIFEGEGRLKDRPLGGLLQTLGAHGARFVQLDDRQLPLLSDGKLTAGEYRIDGTVSSQYITGLLFALPMLDGDSVLRIDGETVSENYIDITLGVLNAFGIKIENADEGYFIKGGQRYKVPEDLKVEGDWSSAGFMLALGALAGEVRVGGLIKDSLQGDRTVVDLLSLAGADIKWNGNEIVARKSVLRAIDFDARNCPDAVPIMATALSFANGVSHIRSVDRLKLKESDRLSAVREMLSDFGIRTEYENDELSIFGGAHKACKTKGFGDHRMAMSAAVCAICTEGESEIEGVECMAKSYPEFLEHARALGAKIKEV